MQRISIIGSCPKGFLKDTPADNRFAYGAGKSTLAKALGSKLNLPVIHLDSYFWQPGWQETGKAEWQQMQPKLLEGDCWIIDGNYGNTMDIRLAAADTIIWLDFNRYLCLWRIFNRYIQYYGKVRPDMAAECPERLNWEFIKYVWNFPKLHRFKIIEKLAKYQNKRRIIILQNPYQVLNFLQHETKVFKFCQGNIDD